MRRLDDPRADLAARGGVKQPGGVSKLGKLRPGNFRRRGSRPEKKYRGESHRMGKNDRGDDQEGNLAGNAFGNDFAEKCCHAEFTSGVNRYPPDRIVLISIGSRGSTSIFWRSLLMRTSMLRSNGAAARPWVRSSS